VITAFAEFLKQFARPSSVTFLIAVLAVGVFVAVCRRTRRLAGAYLTVAFTGYWILATPACAERLVAWQSGHYPSVESASDARGASLIVVLGAGDVTIESRGYRLNELPWMAALRILEGVRVYHVLGAPMIMVSGGITGRDVGARPEAEAMLAALLQLGIPREHVLLETESLNTRDEARVIARMLGSRRSDPIVLVTSPTHMQRSLAVFRSAGLNPVPSVAPYKSEHSMERLRWLPNDTALALSDIAIYDLAATVYYRLRGWMH
jgi:uncharacterized SAM-binding protein YcdF (DUF218 family)